MIVKLVFEIIFGKGRRERLSPLVILMEKFLLIRAQGKNTRFKSASILFDPIKLHLEYLYTMKGGKRLFSYKLCNLTNYMSLTIAR